MRQNIRMGLILLIVATAAVRGLGLMIDQGRWIEGHPGGLIARGEDQRELRRVIGSPIAAALVTDLDGQEEQSRVFAAQIAVTPLAIRILNGRHSHEIPNWLRAGVPVILDSLGADRQAEILALVTADSVAFDQRRAGATYLVLLPKVLR